MWRRVSLRLLSVVLATLNNLTLAECVRGALCVIAGQTSESCRVSKERGVINNCRAGGAGVAESDEVRDLSRDNNNDIMLWVTRLVKGKRGV